MTKRESIKLIDRTFLRLSAECSKLREWDRYLALIGEEEKGHRRYCPSDVQCGLTKRESIRLFAVQTIFERFAVATPETTIFTPQAKDFFSVRHSVFAACAIVELARMDIQAEFSLQEMSQFLSQIDYAELNKDPRLQAD